ncbi:hypothetical protein [Bradyrhizobium genosp. A]|uniref:hypothetical protein n=1 Tax=Bradyrhizobium genosp. A TaxID=83626 RepID=UPI003CF9D259
MPESNGWTLVKIAGLVKEAFERFSGILALLSAVGGISGFVAYYYSLYVLYQTYVLCFVAVFALLTAVLVTWIIATEIFRRRDTEVAAEFLRLENVYLPFEREAVRLLYQVALNTTGSIDVTNLEALHADYLEAICNTAVGVFEAKRPRKGPITANIKRIEESGMSGAASFVYRPLVRSSKYDQHRIEYDEGLEADPVAVQSNFVYRRIFDPRYQDDFFVHGDLAQLLKEITRSREITEEPNERSTEFYQSFIIFPIFGLMESDANAPSVPLSNYMQYKKKNVFGLMCVDSGKRKSFNAGSDADIMKQLTSYAFGAFRLVQAIYDLARRKGLSVETQRRR